MSKLKVMQIREDVLENYQVACDPSTNKAESNNGQLIQLVRSKTRKCPYRRGQQYTGQHQAHNYQSCDGGYHPAFIGELKLPTATIPYFA